MISCIKLRTKGQFQTIVKKCICQRIAREWSNMIGYVLGSSLAGVYTTVKTFPMKNFKL